MSRRRPCSASPGPGSARRVASGVREAARAHSLVRNRRDPSAWPASGKDQGYKPMVKILGGQRESDGSVVPLIGVQHNAPGGKGPNFDHAGEVGKHQGMTGVSRSNSPGRPSPVVADEPLAVSPVNVRRLQRTLWAAAKQSEGRRFHALFDRISRGDVLWEAWERVRANRGAAGVDRITLAAVEDYGVDRMLRELRRDLREGVYSPGAGAPGRNPRNHEVVCGRWGFRRCGTGWPRRRPRSCWNRSSRRTFCRARMGFGRSGRPHEAMERLACRLHRGSSCSWSSLISPISSARSTMTGYLRK